MNPIRDQNINQETYYENSFTHKDEFMDTVLKEVLLDDIRIFFADHKLKKKKVFHPVVKYPPIQMHFLLQGEHKIKSQRTNEICTFKNNQHNMVYLPHHEMDFTYESSTAQLLGIQLTEKFFYRFITESSKELSTFWENILRKKEMQLFSKGNLRITPKIKAILYDIINTKHKGYLKRLFIEAKIIELLVYQLEQRENEDGLNHLNIKDMDIEKLYYVKEMIEQNILSNFSLLGLARKAGLNDFKLKKGFKELFGTTVFNYLHSLKMEYSKQLIIDERKTISETAAVLGYSEPQHFSAAFKKRFGYSPSKLK